MLVIKKFIVLQVLVFSCENYEILTWQHDVNDLLAKF